MEDDKHTIKDHPNLTPFSAANRERSVELGRKGGLASGVSRRATRTFREMSEEIKNKCPDGDIENSIGYKEMLQLHIKARQGNLKAIEMVLKLHGEFMEDIGLRPEQMPAPIVLNFHDTAYIERERQRQEELKRQIILSTNGSTDVPIEVEVDEDDDLPTPTSSPDLAGTDETDDAEKSPLPDGNADQDNPENDSSPEPAETETDVVNALFEDSTPVPTPDPEILGKAEVKAEVRTEPPPPQETPKYAPVADPEQKPAPSPVPTQPKPHEAVSAPTGAVRIPPPPPTVKKHGQARFVCAPAGFHRGRR